MLGDNASAWIAVAAAVSLVEVLCRALLEAESAAGGAAPSRARSVQVGAVSVPRRVAPPRRRCLLCPAEATSGRYCAAHASLVGEPISSSPGVRALKPGARFGPGRLDSGERR